MAALADKEGTTPMGTPLEKSCCWRSVCGRRWGWRESEKRGKDSLIFSQSRGWPRFCFSMWGAWQVLCGVCGWWREERKMVDGKGECGKRRRGGGGDSKRKEKGKGAAPIEWEKKIQKVRGAGLVQRLRGGKSFRFRVFSSCVVFSPFSKLPPLLCVLETSIYRQKWCQVSKLGPSTFFL